MKSDLRTNTLIYRWRSSLAGSSREACYFKGRGDDGRVNYRPCSCGPGPTTSYNYDPAEWELADGTPAFPESHGE